MAAQPAIIYELNSPIDAVALASSASGAAGVAVEVIQHTSGTGEIWSLRTAMVSPNVELHFRGQELLVTFWPEHPHEYFFALVEAFVMSKGAKRHDQSGRQLRHARRRAKLASQTWQEHRRRTSLRGSVFRVLVLGVLVAFLVGYFGR